MASTPPGREVPAAARRGRASGCIQLRPQHIPPLPAQTGAVQGAVPTARHPRPPQRQPQGFRPGDPIDRCLWGVGFIFPPRSLPISAFWGGWFCSFCRYFTPRASRVSCSTPPVSLPPALSCCTAGSGQSAAPKVGEPKWGLGGSIWGFWGHSLMIWGFLGHSLTIIGDFEGHPLGIFGCFGSPVGDTWVFGPLVNDLGVFRSFISDDWVFWVTCWGYLGFLGIPCVISGGFRPFIGNIWVFFFGRSLMILGFSGPFIGDIWGFLGHLLTIFLFWDHS